jgi:solute carrier family 35 protein F5
MLKTTPLVVTTGISLTIPVAVVGDFIINASVRGQIIVGAILVLISFTTIGLDGSREKVF